MTLQTERLLLRPWEEADAADLYEYAKDERVGPAAGWAPHTSVEYSRGIIRDVLSAPESYALCLKEANHPIGCVGLKLGGVTNPGLPPQAAEVGYWLGVPFWEQGLIPEAVTELIRHAFADLKLDTLWCGYFDGNNNSKRVQEKCGFTYHHTVKDAACPQINAVRTVHFTRLTKRDWLNAFTERKLTAEEIPSALALAWKVFSAYEAPVYTAEGVEEFRRTLQNEAYLAGLDYFGAFHGDTLIGLLAIRTEQRHICFYFVDGGYHRLGIGTRLFRYMTQALPSGPITLNAAPFGLPFYQALGFLPTAEEQTVNGIRFTPMRYVKH